jgi:hypothetical protein
MVKSIKFVLALFPFKVEVGFRCLLTTWDDETAATAAFVEWYGFFGGGGFLLVVDVAMDVPVTTAGIVVFGWFDC